MGVLETLLPAALRLYHAEALTLPDPVSRPGAEPRAAGWGWRGGGFRPRAPADLVLFDPDVPYILDRFGLHSKSKNTPFDGGSGCRGGCCGDMGSTGPSSTTARRRRNAMIPPRSRRARHSWGGRGAAGLCARGSVPFGIVQWRGSLWPWRFCARSDRATSGATNVLRTGNKLAAFLTLVLDAGKGAIRGAGCARHSGRGRGTGRGPCPPPPRGAFLGAIATRSFIGLSRRQGGGWRPFSGRFSGAGMAAGAGGPARHGPWWPRSSASSSLAGIRCGPVGPGSGRSCWASPRQRRRWPSWRC